MTDAVHPTGKIMPVTRLIRRIQGHRQFASPQKALILQPCCLGRVMQTTPLLAALSQSFPTARFDWAVSDWARQAVSNNPRLTRILLTGAGDIEQNTPAENRALQERMRREGYDTCFIPDRSDKLQELARRAGIPQRISLNTRGLDHEATERRLALSFLAMAGLVGVDQAIIQTAEMEFDPPDRDRTTVTRWLVEEYDWLGDTPLVIFHPGGGDNPEEIDLDKRWPGERLARLANYLIKNHQARVVLVGTAEEHSLAAQITGMVSFPVINRAGKIGLGELGALCELAALYVGYDSGSTHIAAATGCPTLVIYGPTNPAIHGPHMINSRVITLWHPYDGEFSWQNGVTLDEAVEAAEALLAMLS
jgi:heptosyltransferase II